MKTVSGSLVANTLIILVVLFLAFALFWTKRDGGAYLIGLISGAPVAAGVAAMNKKTETGNNTPDVPNASTEVPDAPQAISATTINVGTPAVSEETK